MTRRKTRRERGQVTVTAPNLIWIIALVLVAIVAGLALGLTLNQSAPDAPVLSTVEGPVLSTVEEPVLSTVEGPTPTHTPVATIPIGPAPLGATPNPHASLSIRVDIRDARTGEPVRANVWVGQKLVAEDTSLHEFTLTEMQEKGAKYAPLKIQAEGYQPWEKLIRFNVEFDRLIPLGVELEPLSAPEPGGGGA